MTVVSELGNHRGDGSVSGPEHVRGELTGGTDKRTEGSSQRKGVISVSYT